MPSPTTAGQIERPELTNSERKAAADRLWRIIGMIDEGASSSTIREAVKFTVQEIEPPDYWPKSKPVNLGRAA